MLAENGSTSRSSSAAPTPRSPLSFALLVLALAVPIWMLGRFAGVIGSLKIPVTDLLLAFIPLVAAAIMVWRNEGVGGLIAFLKSTLEFARLARSNWLWPALLLAPLIYSLTFLGVHVAGHQGVPVVYFSRLPVLAIIMFLLAIGEEAGWTGYLLDPLQDRFGALGASLIIAVPWWLGHIPSIIAIGGTASDIAYWLPGAIALRVLMTWLYNGASRSLVAVILFHTMLNVGRSVAYPTIGSQYDPVYQVTGYGIASIMAALAVMSWGAAAKSQSKMNTPPSAR